MSTPSHPTLTIGIVAGEVSGDMLGADLMEKLNALHPNICWVGVGGAQMSKQGLSSLIDMSRLSVMGIGEVVRHLPDLFSAKAAILQAFDDAAIDIFIGIDAPDFNLRLGKALKNKGVFCVQYVSPSIWAWREGRIHTIKKATHLVLCLFPFELPVYAKHQHPAICVGHPLIHTLTPPNTLQACKEILHQKGVPALAFDKPLLTLMAGSRIGEINAILPLLLNSFTIIAQEYHGIHAILPLAKAEHKPLVQTLIKTTTPSLVDRLHLVVCDTVDSPQSYSLSQCAMLVGQAVILASGTATLEALLLHRPMVVVYKVKPITYYLAKKLLKTPYVALPNILHHHLENNAIVDELLQDDATPTKVAHACLALLQHSAPLQKANLAKLSTAIKQASSDDPAVAILTAYQGHLV